MEAVMGIGDEIIGTRHFARSPAKKPIRIVDNQMKTRTHEVWAYNPYINKDALNLYPWNSSCRPYIDYGKSTVKHWAFREDYRVEPGEIYFSPQEQVEIAAMKDYIIIEPTVKGALQQNKAWPLQYWQDLVDANGSIPYKQLVYNYQQPNLRGVEIVMVHSVRAWLIHVAAAIAVVTTEGGLHHAAAALDIPAVVLFSGFISPNIMGYQLGNHRNLMHHYQYEVEHNKSSCGLKVYCSQCHANMDNLDVEQVHRALFSLPVKEAR